MNYDSYMVSNQGLISGTETRISAQARYDDGKTSFSLGTNFWAGLKGVNGESLNQQTGFLSMKSGDFGLSYENDGAPFDKKSFLEEFYLGEQINIEQQH